MPKLPQISGLECVKALKRLGFVEVRQRGSHLVMRHGESGCVVPMHKEIKVGTLAGVMRQAGISVEEFSRHSQDENGGLHLEGASNGWRFRRGGGNSGMVIPPIRGAHFTQKARRPICHRWLGGVTWTLFFRRKEARSVGRIFADSRHPRLDWTCAHSDRTMSGTVLFEPALPNPKNQPLRRRSRPAPRSSPASVLAGSGTAVHCKVIPVKLN